MGLNLEISLDKDAADLVGFLDDLKFRAVTLAARQAINRSGIRIRSLAIKEIRKRQKLKLKDLKGSSKRRGSVTFSKATGLILNRLEGRLNFSGKQLPLILFILGQKTPKVQKLPNPRRKSRRFEIRKGLKKKKPGLFIQRAKRGDMEYQVFRRANPSDRTKGFKVQSAPSVAEFLRAKSHILAKIELNGLTILQKEYDTALRFQLSKLKL